MPPNRNQNKEELAGEMDRLQEIVQNLEARLQDAENWAARQTPPHLMPGPAHHAHAYPSRAKVAVPDVFNGEMDATDRFIKQLGLYFLARPADFPMDIDRIVFALSYMKGGTAGVWADQVTETILEGGIPYIDYPEFSRALKARFGDPDAATTARRKLELVRQNARSVDEYVSEFQTYAPRTGYNETALIEIFQRGLTYKITAQLYNLPDLPTTLDEWIMYASRFDRQHRAFEARRGPSENRRPTANPSVGRPTPNPTQPSQPAAPPGTTKTNPIVKQEPGSQRLCWKCSSPDHLARDCPTTEVSRLRTLIREIVLGIETEGETAEEVEAERDEEGEAEETKEEGF